MNRLHYGDNLTLMQQMPLASVDLIYLDPPFKSNQNYNLIYRTLTGKPVPDQAEAFCDTWEMDAEKERLASTMPVLMREKGVEDYYVTFWQLWIKALRNTRPHLMAYLIYMVVRLLYMKTLLRPQGSIYLHCDPEASHYIKIMMDGIFGHDNFRNEIIWRRTGSHGARRIFGPIHDVIFFYSKGPQYYFGNPKRPYMKGHVDRRYRLEDSGKYKFTSGGNVLTGRGITTKGDSGKTWRGFNPSAKNRHWAIPGFLADQMSSDFGKLGVIEKLDALYEFGLIDISEGNAWPTPVRYLEEGDGVSIQDIWAYQPYTEGTVANTNDGIDADVRWLGPTDPERLGYPTQKPVGLLKRIILASSKKGDVIFDPFCGCGTTIYAAEETERKWIGCDIAILAIKLIKEVLDDRYRLSEGTHFEVNGIPVSVEQAKVLFDRDPHQFQNWFVERVGGLPLTKKGADRGIDGRLYFEIAKDDLREMVFSVKGGNIRPTDVRDLRGVLERESNVELACFLSMKEPTKAMKREAAEAGMYECNGAFYPRIQMLTVKEVLEDKKDVEAPSIVRSRINSGQALLPL